MPLNLYGVDCFITVNSYILIIESMRNNFTILLNIVCRLDTNDLRVQEFQSRRY